MIRKIINPILLIPLILFITSQRAIFSETKDYIDGILQEKDDKIIGLQVRPNHWKGDFQQDTSAIPAADKRFPAILGPNVLTHCGKDGV